MIRQIPGKIYLSQLRGCNESNTFRSFRSFNFEEYADKERLPFGQLYAFNEDTLAPGHSSKIKSVCDSLVIILPLAGFIHFQNSDKKNTTISAGEAMVTYMLEGHTFTVSNPSENTLAGYLQILIKSPENPGAGSELLCFEFNLEKSRNTLIDIFKNETPGFIQLSIGQFSMRKKTGYKMKNQGFFAFVIEGEFEVQDRLLHTRDGLALWGTDNVDMECLSHEAILLVADIQLA